MDTTSSIHIVEALQPQQLALVSSLMREYEATLKVNLGFQSFDEEVATLPGAYAPPQGTLLLAYVLQQPSGIVALQPLTDSDYPQACEMKRLYVRPQARRVGLGRVMAERLIDTARAMGYKTMLLDTLDDMEAARGLYESLGFEEIPPYYFNPIAGAHYLKVDLS
jgi:putative acetyltransferase